MGLAFTVSWRGTAQTNVGELFQAKPNLPAKMAENMDLKLGMYAPRDSPDMTREKIFQK